MSVTRIAAGNVVEASVTFTPESGTVALGDVSARLLKHDGTEVTLSGITTPGTNVFEVEWVSTDADPTGIYRIRWESNAPSPKIVVEDDTTQFALIGSRFATP